MAGLIIFRVLAEQLFQFGPLDCSQLESKLKSFQFETTLGPLIIASYCGFKAQMKDYEDLMSTDDFFPTATTEIPPDITEVVTRTETRPPDTPDIVTGSPPVVYNDTSGFVELGKCPWMALVYVNDGGSGIERHYGGSLITDRFVLVPAHIVDRTPATKVRLGFVDIEDTSHGEEYEVEKNIIHSEFYRDNSWGNNVALLRLKTKVVFNEYIRPIPPPTQYDRVRTFVCDNVFVVGWEDPTEPGAKDPGKLRMVLARWIPESNCRNLYRGSNLKFLSNLFCTETKLRGQNPCTGMEGAPVVRRGNDGDWSLIGLMALGDYCKMEETKPSVNTRIYPFMYWIHEKLLEYRENVPPKYPK